MKISKYNKLIEAEGKYLFFNGLTGALLKINHEIKEVIEKISSSEKALADFINENREKEIFKTLSSGFFIVNKNFDEIGFLKTRYNISRFNNAIKLTILPTLSCNLDCFYCYENVQNINMTKNTEKNLITFFKTLASLKPGRKIYVDWYGGEPLLAINTIKRLSEAFLDICKKNNCTYQSYMVTNGTLLTEEKLKILSDCMITKYQITIDGPREVHDKRRKLKNDKDSSFDLIINNITHIIGKAEIMLRINCDKNNEDAVFQLLDIFNEKGWLVPEKKFFPYLAAVTPFTESCSNVKGDCLKSDDFYRTAKRFTKCLDQYISVKTNTFYLYPVTKRNNCGAVCLNSYLVNPNGNIFKCSINADNDSRAIGSIAELDSMMENPFFHKWMNFDPFSLEQCIACDILPLCLAGCPLNSLDNNRDRFEENCRYMKNNYEEMILFHGS